MVMIDVPENVITRNLTTQIFEITNPSGKVIGSDRTMSGAIAEARRNGELHPISYHSSNRVILENDLIFISKDDKEGMSNVIETEKELMEILIELSGFKLKEAFTDDLKKIGYILELVE